MNILFFIGNGFDINLGMKTRYCDFYEYYKKVDSKSSIVNELKEEISSGVTNWSDLELAFGQYTKRLKDLGEFDEVYEDIVNNLAEYLSKEQENNDLTSAKLDKFLRYLIYPERYLTDEDFQELRIYRRNWSGGPWNMNIITLNYTETIERIMDDDAEDLSIGSNEYGHKVHFRKIHHIHGYTDRRLVLGVNDISQIGNVGFHDEEEITESLIKTKSNKVQRHNIDRACERLINEANLICIFGSSIGDTDNHWWELMGNQLKRDCKIVIFNKGEAIKERFAQRAARTRRTIRKLFLDKTSLSDTEKKQFEDNVYVGVNTNMFSFS